MVVQFIINTLGCAALLYLWTLCIDQTGAAWLEPLFLGYTFYLVMSMLFEAVLALAFSRFGGSPLIFFGGVTRSEIFESLGKNTQTVRRRLHF